MRKCSGDLGSRPLRTGPPSSLTFLVRQAHGQNLPGGDGVFQKHVRELRGDSGPGRIGRGGGGRLPTGDAGRGAARSSRGGCAPSAWSPPPFAESGSSALKSQRKQGVCGEMSLSLFLSRPALRVLCAWISPRGPGTCTDLRAFPPARSTASSPVSSASSSPTRAWGPRGRGAASSSCAHSPPTIRWLRSSSLLSSDALN